MGAYSTRTVTRQQAINTILGKVYSVSNEKLAEMLFDLVGEETLNNFIVEGEIETI